MKKEFNRLSVRKISHFNDVHPSLAKQYSRMKYGDPKAVKKFSQKLAMSVLTNKNLMNLITKSKKLVVTSSAYGEVPTAAHAIAVELVGLFQQLGLSVKMAKVERKGDFSTTEYGKLSLKERQKKMSARKIYVSSENRKLFAQADVIVVDDLFATGSHEKTMFEVLTQQNARSISFCYVVQFSKDLSLREPETEEKLNSAAVKVVTDLLPFFNSGPYKGTELSVNARATKFILSIERESLSDKPKALKREYLRWFLSSVNDEPLKKIYVAATSKDGYYRDPKFAKGYRELELYTTGKGLAVPRSPLLWAYRLWVIIKNLKNVNWLTEKANSF